MKKLFLTLFAGLAALNLLAAEDKPYIVKTFSSSSVKDLQVSTSGGGITVAGTAGAESRVEVYIKGSNWNRELSKAEIEERLENYTLTIRQEGSSLVCVARNKEKINWGKNGLSITFKIYVPRNISTDLSTSGGGITLSSLKGNLKFATSGGGLNLKELDGTIVGSTSGGGIRLSDCTDKIDLHTSGGGIEAINCDGTIKLVTSGGGITLKAISGKINATTSGGSIRVDGIKGDASVSTSGGGIHLFGVSGNMKASTSGGGIEAEISSLGENLALNTSAGSVKVKLPSRSEGLNVDLRGNNVDFEGLSNFEGRKDRNNITGTVNGGGKNIKIHASSGSVKVSR